VLAKYGHDFFKLAVDLGDYIGGGGKINTDILPDGDEAAAIAFGL
jgi:hypothetical protein